MKLLRETGDKVQKTKHASVNGERHCGHVGSRTGGFDPRDVQQTRRLWSRRQTEVTHDARASRP